MSSIITKRFIACHDRLKQKRVVRSSRQFAIALDYQPQNLSEILNGRREAPVKLIHSAVSVFGFSPKYLFTGEGSMFLLDNRIESEVQTTKEECKQTILHVPTSTQNGYPREPNLLVPGELPEYHLPMIDFGQGIFQSFDIKSDSMYPLLREGDILISKKLDPAEWISKVKNRCVYVIVTEDNIFVKRVVNGLAKHRHVELLSDNIFYKSMRVNVREIKELWYPMAKLGKFEHEMIASNSRGNAQSEILYELKNMLTRQSSVLSEISGNLKSTVV